MKNKNQIDDKTKIILFIVGLIILISTMIFFIYNQKQGENYNYLKQDKNNYLENELIEVKINIEKFSKQTLHVCSLN